MVKSLFLIGWPGLTNPNGNRSWNKPLLSSLTLVADCLHGVLWLCDIPHARCHWSMKVCQPSKRLGLFRLNVNPQKIQVLVEWIGGQLDESTIVCAPKKLHQSHGPFLDITNIHLVCYPPDYSISQHIPTISQQLLMFASRIPYRKISEFYPGYSPSIPKPNPHCLHNTCLYPVPIGYVMLCHNYPGQQVLCRSLICSQSDTQGTWSVASRPSPGYCPGRIEPYHQPGSPRRWPMDPPKREAIQHFLLGKKSETTLTFLKVPF
jgi:hypothetical protein